MTDHHALRRREDAAKVANISAQLKRLDTSQNPPRLIPCNTRTLWTTKK